MRCGLDKSFKGDAPCGNALEAFRTNVVAHNARLRYSSFEGNLIIPALLMLLFCTILRRNYPARLNGQGLKSQATFSIFLFSFFIFVFPFSSLSSFFFLSFFFSISRNRARRGITILISPRDFYRFLSHSVPLNERRHLIVGGEDDRRLPLFTQLPTFFVSIFFFFLSLGLPLLSCSDIYMYPFTIDLLFHPSSSSSTGFFVFRPCHEIFPGSLFRPGGMSLP